MADEIDVDVLIGGGGLAGGLLALALAERRPDLAIVLVEPGARIGGNHIWSFFDSDVAPDMRWLVEPLVSCRWMGNDVRFQGHARTLSGGYNSIESEQLDAAVRALVAPEAIIRAAVTALDGAGAVLANGRRIRARAVIDARGAAGSLSPLRLGWQKFVGRMLRLRDPHGLSRPVIMDAAVDQTDGYRFVYVLPFDDRRVFVEDTYYTTTPDLDVDDLRTRIDGYAARRGWVVETVEREEAAALPIAMGGRFDAFWPTTDPVPRIGMAAGLFHPMTGYSLPDAVRTAKLVCGLPDLSTPILAKALRDDAVGAWRQRGFYRLLTRMLFLAAEPPERHRLLERFYRLDEGLIARFYAGRSSTLDKARVLVGKPPVPLRRALVAATAKA
ncbi:lycopene beta-cyclase CrtY [uncultured Sphingomonas sp.]|uniref:lycopene beta-cyclase CrtY n=1 Tax=uncultured Sphingomonas sp. TaxID=158754 RepID=UPI0025E4143A|nr:lycopene beta-cyclase CrtY [uncultured Sphingomonas sp.]